MVLQGLVDNGNASVVATLPIGFRPLKQLVFYQPMAGLGQTTARVDVTPAGEVMSSAFPIARRSQWLSLSGITFKLPAF